MPLGEVGDSASPWREVPGRIRLTRDQGARRGARAVGTSGGRGASRSGRRGRGLRRGRRRGRRRGGRRGRARSVGRAAPGRGGARRQEPRCAVGRAAGAVGEGTEDARRLGDRAGGAPPAEPARRRHRHEREDDDDRLARRDPRCGAGRRRGRREHRTSAELARRPCDPGNLDRVRALLVSARGRRDAASPRGRADEPRAGPPRPARRPGGVRGGEAPRLRAPTRR